jgi:hypothetical protein
MFVIVLAEQLALWGFGMYEDGGGEGPATIFVNRLPLDMPDGAIMVKDVGGIATPGYESADYKNIQILTRHVNQVTAGELINSIYDKIANMHTVNIPNVAYIIDTQALPPGYIGVDSKGRHEYSMNATFYIGNDEKEGAEV